MQQNRSYQFRFILLAALLGGLLGALIASRFINSPSSSNVSFFRAIEKARPVVVSIDVSFQTDGKPDTRFGSASGIIYDGRKGYILTNAHVIKPNSALRVRLWNGKKYKAKLIGQDRISDIALLQISAKGLPTAVLGNSRDLPVGSWVVAIGNPLLFDGSVTAGIISGVGRNIGSPVGSIDMPDLIQTDAAINFGNSGGALVNLQGEVVGIPTAMLRGNLAEGLGFAVPIDRVKEVAETLEKYHQPRHPWLGIRYEDNLPLPGDDGFSASRNFGVRIIEVAKASPAEKAGLQKGDIIRFAADKKILHSKDLQEQMKAFKVDDRLSLVIERQGENKKLTVKIGNLPDIPLAELFPKSTPAPATPPAK